MLSLSRASRGWVLALTLSACSGTSAVTPGNDAATADSAAGQDAVYVDTVNIVDSAADAGVADAGVADAGIADAGVADAGVADAGVADAGVADAGVADAGVADAGVADAGVADAGVADAGVADAGVADAGVADAGVADAGVADAGVADAGVADAGVADAGVADAGVADAGVADAGASDPNIAGVVLLLHFDGSEGSQNFVDVGNHTVRADGNAQITQRGPRFGTGAGRFDGNGDQLYIAPRAQEFFFEGTAPFTIEAWVSGTGTIFSNDTFGLVLSIKDERTLFAWVNGMLPWDYVGTAAGTVPTGWHHVALSFDGTTYRWFIDGAVTLARAGQLSGQAANHFTVGGYSAGTQPWFNGDLDELRVTRGVARYTANFAPPTAPFPDR